MSCENNIRSLTLRILFLAIAFTFSFYAQAQWSGNGTITDPYRLQNPLHLAELALLVQKGTDYSNTYFALTNNIDLSTHTDNWLPIGIGNTPFNGIFDGAGNTIHGLSIEASRTPSQGLFGSVKNATIKHLTITNPTIKGRAYVAAAVGLAYDSRIEAITVINGSVTSNDSHSYIGSIVGYCHQSIIVGCTATDVSLQGTRNSCSVGGIVGYSHHYGIVTGCVSRVRELGDRGMRGCIVGWNSILGTIKSTVSVCYYEASGDEPGIGNNLGNHINVEQMKIDQMNTSTAILNLNQALKSTGSGYRYSAGITSRQTPLCNTTIQ